MNRPTNKNWVSCIAYVSAKNWPTKPVEEIEAKQLKYIRDYAAANKIVIKGVVHRGLLGAYEASRQFEYILKRIRVGEADAVLAVNMAAIAEDIPDAYYKAGKVNAAGGRMITVEEGELRLILKARCGYGAN